MSRRIRILEIINEATIGGGQTHVLQLASGLDRNRFAVSVACTDNGPLTEQLRAIDVPVHPFAISSFASPSTLRAMVRLLADRRIDIVHTHGGIAGVWGRLAAWVAKTPVCIHTLHGIHYLHYRSRFKRILFISLDRLLAIGTEKIICVSEADRQAGIAAGCFPADRAVLIRNGIPVPSLPADFTGQGKRTELSLPAAAVVIGTVGRLHRQKGQRRFLEAIHIVRQEIPDLIALVVGDGPLRSELQTRTRELGLQDHVRFLGSRRDVAELIALMDVFVLSSEWEGMPLSLLEAMALERPVAAFAIPGVTEAVRDNESGALAKPQDAGSLAQAILRLLHDREQARRLAKTGRQIFFDHFQEEKMVHATAELYASLYDAGVAEEPTR
ncbi:MAG: putative glycosyltransferase EpsD [bacterium ADurb.Bin478]|nr:MAG: putative glycosyltransferase EpsD [bacterium ADurb.Bin478]